MQVIAVAIVMAAVAALIALALALRGGLAQFLRRGAVRLLAAADAVDHYRERRSHHAAAANVEVAWLTRPACEESVAP